MPSAELATGLEPLHFVGQSWKVQQEIPLAMAGAQVEVTVRSGAKYLVARELLCSYSNVFKAGLRHTKKLCLPDVSDSTFEVFRFWLYGQGSRARFAPVPKKSRSSERSPVRITSLLGNSEHVGKSESYEVQPCDERVPHGRSTTPAWLRDLNIDLDLSKPSWNSSSPHIPRSTFLDHFTNRTFIDVAAFAEDFGVPLLSEDIMTIITELHNLNPADRGSQWTRDDIICLYMSLPYDSPLIDYAVREIALGDMLMLYEGHIQEVLPKQFWVDLCRVLLSGVDDIEHEVRDCCGFHHHHSVAEVRRCKERQMRDGAFYASLLKACVEMEVVFHEELRQAWAGISNVPSKRSAVCSV